MGDRPGRLAAVRARLDALGAPRGEVDASAPALHPGHPRGAALLGSGVALRDQVRRGARAGRAPGRARDPLRAERAGHDLALPGGGARAAGARHRALRHRRGDRGARRRGAAELPAPAAAHGAHRPARDRRWPRSSGPRSASSSTASCSTIATCVAVRSSSARSACGSSCPRSAPVRYGDHVVGEGDAFFEAASAQRLEGIVAKKARGALPGRANPRLDQDQVPEAAGVRDRRLHRPARLARALRRAAPRPLRRTGPGAAPRLRLEGRHRVRPGRARRDLGAAPPARPRDAALRGRRRADRARPPLGRAARWSARCASPTGPRTAGSVTRRSSACARTGSRRSAGARRRKRSRRSMPPGRASPAVDAPPAPATAREPAPRLKVTNPRKVFWPAEGYTKADLIEYYERIAPFMLPYLRDRPLVLTRFPDGIAGQVLLPEGRARVRAAVGAHRAHLLARTPSATSRTWWWTTWRCSATWPTARRSRSTCWASRVPSLERPDWLVLDLDPKGAPFTDVVRVALALRGILDGLALPSYVKTSGATGLHILLPLGAALHLRAGAHLRASPRDAGRRGASPRSPRWRGRCGPAAARSTSTSGRTATGRPSWRPSRCGRCPARPPPARSSGAR